MISGMLPNNTIWWLSTNGQKIWIESDDLEQDKFKEKGYNVKGDIILHAGQIIGELTASRLESRKRKDAWIVKVESVIDIYPELIVEIQKKESENKKKKRELSSKNRKSTTAKTFISKEEQIKEPAKTSNVSGNIEIKDENTFKDTVEHKYDKEPQRDRFDVSSPYVSWIKDEIEKSENGVTISFGSLKEKMGGEFLNMHNLRIFFGLQKILPSIGITVEQGYKAREHAVIMKKIL